MIMDKVKRLVEQNEFLNDMIESLEDVKAGRVREWKIEKEHS